MPVVYVSLKNVLPHSKIVYREQHKRQEKSQDWNCHWYTKSKENKPEFPSFLQLRFQDLMQFATLDNVSV